MVQFIADIFIGYSASRLTKSLFSFGKNTKSSQLGAFLFFNSALLASVYRFNKGFLSTFYIQAFRFI